MAFFFFLSGCAGVPTITHIQVADEGNDLPVAAVQAPAGATPYARLPAQETLTYEIRCLGVGVGTITASVSGIKNYNGREAYLLGATVKTNAFFSRIHKIDDRLVSYLDTEKLHTLRQEVYRREGSYRKESVTEFDQAQHKAYFKDLLSRSEKTFDIPEGVQDVLSASYALMLQPLPLGTGVEYYVYHNEQVRRYFCLVSSNVLVRSSALGDGPVQGVMIFPFATRKEGKVAGRGKVTAYYCGEGRTVPVYASIVKVPFFAEAGVSLLSKKEAAAAPKKD